MSEVAEGRRIRIRGTVQGVGFRPWVYRIASDTGVRGRVRNDASGVTIEAFADRSTLQSFEQALHASPPPAAHITGFATAVIPAEPVSTFVIEPSRPGTARHVSIPPDLGTCEACVADVFDPANRRYGYPFTNCTNCGPRFTIATDAPYDRSATTMAPFEMCSACRSEYEDVGDRRFHAQPVACPVCGPLLTAVWTGKALLTSRTVTDPVREAARALRAGLIVAVKGIGGFHLACDATNDAAVRRLRARKHREAKPLAVMVPSLAAAETLAQLEPVHRVLLEAPERPIVLASSRVTSSIAESVTPRNRQVGLMLAYSPLHHLLMAEVDRPLVMTSGNLSEEPIVCTNDDAMRRLGSIADLMLLHDRDIHTRCDDSVVAVVAGAPMVLRRSRGFVPRPIELKRPIPVPVLATGALLKNTFCLASGTEAFLGPHIGDLENLETYDAFRSAIAKFERFVDIHPMLVACDAHPDYLSTMYAERRGEPVIRVQHHHAHVVSGMAEHHLDGPVIGVAYDGTGYGFDGTSWGGEVLCATPAWFERLASFRPIALIGGDAAVREPWRVAMALLVDAFDGDVPASALGMLLPSVSDEDKVRMIRLIESSVQVSLARGVGRYFDGFGALFLDRRRAAFEGQVALEWNQLAEPGVTRKYPFDIDNAGTLVEADLRPTVRAAVSEALAGVPGAEIAAVFHNTLAAATAQLVVGAAKAVGRLPVVLTGGCFQNARLAESTFTALSSFDVHLHSQIPPGDGGIALGQAVVASAIAESGGNETAVSCGTSTRTRREWE
jgi:hydrogenase maturation protein HypF